MSRLVMSIRKVMSPARYLEASPYHITFFDNSVSISFAPTKGAAQGVKLIPHPYLDLIVPKEVAPSFMANLFSSVTLVYDVDKCSKSSISLSFKNVSRDPENNRSIYYRVFTAVSWIYNSDFDSVLHTLRDISIYENELRLAAEFVPKLRRPGIVIGKNFAITTFKTSPSIGFHIGDIISPDILSGASFRTLMSVYSCIDVNRYHRIQKTELDRYILSCEYISELNPPDLESQVDVDFSLSSTAIFWEKIRRFILSTLPEFISRPATPFFPFILKTKGHNIIFLSLDYHTDITYGTFIATLLKIKELFARDQVASFEDLITEVSK